MSPETLRTSSRLRKAAVAERVDLEGHRDRLISDRERLQSEIEQIERALADVDDRLALLGQIAPAVSDMDEIPRDQCHPAAVPAGDAFPAADAEGWAGAPDGCPAAAVPLFLPVGLSTTFPKRSFCKPSGGV